MNVDGRMPVPTDKLLDTIEPVERSIDTLDAATVALLPVTKLAVTPPVRDVKSLYFPDLNMAEPEVVSFKLD
jgi:hypothetical protein